MIRSFHVLLVAALCACAAFAAPRLTYTLGMPHPSSHLFEIELRVDGLAPADSVLDLVLPVWRPGRYVIFDFAGGVERFSADDGSGNALHWRKTDKTTWRVHPAGSTVVARYLVFADEPHLRTRSLDDEHGFVDATSVFMMVAGYRSAPLTLVVRPFGAWHVTTGLDAAPGRPSTFLAQGYDELADSPLEIGTQRDYDFTVDGVPHVFSIMGRTNCETDSILAWTKRIVIANAAFWGGLPYRRYVFLLRFMPDAGGATEHINSCVLDMPSTVFRTPDPCRQIVGLISHEFFHTWNVKRLRPKSMDPYDFTRENYSREIWLAEGGTSYFHNILLVRCGLSQAGAFVRGLPGRVHDDRARPGDTVQSPAACSFDAWIKYNRPSAASYNFETDLYGRGSDVSLNLDLELRHRSDNKASFDELMRTLYRRFPLESGGYTVEDVERTAVDLAGEGMKQFFARYIYGAAPLPWETTLEYAGLRLAPVPGSQRAWLGLTVANDRGNPAVRAVVAGSPAYEAGMDAGDQLLALDGLRIRAEEFSRRIAEYEPGDSIRLSFFHHDTLRELTITLARNPVPAYAITRVDHPDRLQRAVYEAWLGHSWNAARLSSPRCTTRVTLTVFNTPGQMIAPLVHAVVGAGCHEVRFDGGNLASGIHFCRLTANAAALTRKLMR